MTSLYLQYNIGYSLSILAIKYPSQGRSTATLIVCIFIYVHLTGVLVFVCWERVWGKHGYISSFFRIMRDSFFHFCIHEKMVGGRSRVADDLMWGFGDVGWDDKIILGWPLTKQILILPRHTRLLPKPSVHGMFTKLYPWAEFEIRAAFDPLILSDSYLKEYMLSLQNFDWRVK